MGQPPEEESGTHKGTAVSDRDEEEKTACLRMNQSEVLFDGRHERCGKYPGQEVEKEDTRDKDQQAHF
jgi:hypothetical protein